MADKLLPHGGGILLEQYDGAQVGPDAISKFPSLREEIEDADGLLHLQLSALARGVRDCILCGDIVLANEILSFVDSALCHPKASPEIENAVALSFVEPWELRQSEVGQALLAEMPATLKQVLLEQERRGGAQ